MKPDIKSEYEVAFLGTEQTAIVKFNYYKEIPSGDYDVPNDASTVEIDKIEIDTTGNATDLADCIQAVWESGSCSGNA